jgi:RNA polymerase sigma-70 factor (ECF subfamily)
VTYRPEPGPPEDASVHRAVEQLPEHQRTLVELAHWRGLSQSEIATHLEIPLVTVKTRARAALGRLAQLLEEEQLQ